MNVRQRQDSLQKQMGQSLVEVALFMPILLILIVGVVEVSQLVVTQNRINTAARNGARFGAQGGEDLGINHITLNTVTQTLDLTEGVWDIFVVRGELNSQGELPASNFSSQQIYGTGQTGAYTQTTTSAAWDGLREEIVDRLSYPGTDPAGLKVVGVLILHDVDSILGLDILPALMGRNTIRGFSIMRNSALATTVTQSDGCAGAYPLGVEEGIRSITRQEFENLTFIYPASGLNYNSYPAHQPDKALLGEGREGYIYKLNILQGTNHDPQHIGLLLWNDNNVHVPGTTPQGLLEASLQYPGNSTDPIYGYEEPLDSSDHEMHVGDEVWRSSVNHQLFLNAATGPLRNHIDTGRALRLLLWNVDEHPGSGRLKISGFAIFQILAYGDDGGARGNWIMLELTRIDDSCGQS